MDWKPVMSKFPAQAAVNRKIVRKMHAIKRDVDLKMNIRRLNGSLISKGKYRMANKLKQLFGIDYELRDITQEKITDAGTQQLIKQIQPLELEEGNKAELYFFQLA